MRACTCSVIDINPRASLRSRARAPIRFAPEPGLLNRPPCRGDSIRLVLDTEAMLQEERALLSIRSAHRSLAMSTTVVALPYADTAPERSGALLYRLAGPTPISTLKAILRKAGALHCEKHPTAAFRSWHVCRCGCLLVVPGLGKPADHLWSTRQSGSKGMAERKAPGGAPCEDGACVLFREKDIGVRKLLHHKRRQKTFLSTRALSRHILVPNTCLLSRQVIALFQDAVTVMLLRRASWVLPLHQFGG